jgi:hypothetical protein
MLLKKEYRAGRRREREARREAEQRWAGAQGAASDCRLIDPKTGVVIGTIPRRSQETPPPRVR